MTTTTNPDASNIKLLCLNCFGAVIASTIHTRMRAIGAFIRQGGHSLVILQEQFQPEHLESLMEGLRADDGSDAGLWHVARNEDYPALMGGCGLTILSKGRRIVSTTFIPYSVTGRVERIWELCHFMQRGIFIIKVELTPTTVATGSDNSDGAPVHQQREMLTIFSTHLNAQFQDYKRLPGGYKGEANAPYRLVQAYELARCVSATIVNPAVNPFLIAGDMNCGPNSPEMQLLRAVLRDRGLPVRSVIRTGHRPDPWTLSEDNPYNAKQSGTYLQMLGMQEMLPQQVDHIFLPVASCAFSRHVGKCGDLGAVVGSDGDTEGLSRMQLRGWGDIVLRDPVPVPPASGSAAEGSSGEVEKVQVSDHYGIEAVIAIDGHTAAGSARLAEAWSGASQEVLDRTADCGPQFAYPFLTKEGARFKRKAVMIISTAVLLWGVCFKLNAGALLLILMGILGSFFCYIATRRLLDAKAFGLVAAAIEPLRFKSAPQTTPTGDMPVPGTKID